RARHAPGTGSTRPAPRLALPRLRRALAGTTLVEYLALDGRLHAVVVAARRTTLHDLGAVDDVRARGDVLRFGLRRLAHSGPAARARPPLAQAPVPRAVARITATVERAARELDAALLAPLRLPPGDLVVVPTGLLHAVPWAVLPSC